VTAAFAGSALAATTTGRLVDAGALAGPWPSSNARARAPSSLRASPVLAASDFAASGFATSGFGGASFGAADGSLRGGSLRASGLGAGSLRVIAGAVGRGGSPLRSPTTPLLTRAVAGAAEATRGGGNGSDGAPSFFGISIAMSTGIGRGCVSNSNGKP